MVYTRWLGKPNEVMGGDLDMQSSSVVTFRALIMLSCLVAVPLAAVFGTSLPEVVSAILAGQWPGNSDSPDGAIGDGPRFEPVMPGEMASMVPPRRMPPAVEGHPLPRPLPSAPSLPSSPVAWDAPNGPTAATPGVVPIGYETPVVPGRAINTSVQTPVSVDRFTYIQNRLRQLGATYFLLEMFEGREEEERYRFHCCIPVGGNPSYTRKYEALDSSPIGAMAGVLAQVETRSTVGP